ncbi:MAG: hypothetical protein K6V73_05690 [Firmicutes bacterium]|nr:hypothetical protein [Bacillota bacterium]
MDITVGLLFAAATLVLVLSPWTWRLSPEWITNELERWYPNRPDGETVTRKPGTLVWDAEEDLRTGKPRDDASSAKGTGR